MDVRKEHFWGPEGKGAGEALGKQLAAKMTEQGAVELLREIRRA